MGRPHRVLCVWTACACLSERAAVPWSMAAVGSMVFAWMAGRWQDGNVRLLLFCLGSCCCGSAGPYLASIRLVVLALLELVGQHAAHRAFAIREPRRRWIQAPFSKVGRRGVAWEVIHEYARVPKSLLCARSEGQRRESYNNQSLPQTASCPQLSSSSSSSPSCGSCQRHHAIMRARGGASQVFRSHTNVTFWRQSPLFDQRLHHLLLVLVCRVSWRLSQPPTLLPLRT